MNMDFNIIKVAFPYRGGIRYFNPDHIIRLKSDSNYTHAYFTDHKPILVARVLADYSDLLEPLGFLRTHRSHLINPKYISEIRQNTIIMDDDSEAEISRSRRKKVLKTLAPTP